MKKECEKVVISTVYSGRSIKIAINKLAPDKLILLIDEPIETTKKQTIEDLKKNFGDIIKIETLKTPLYELPDIIEKVTKKIDEESSGGNEIIIHITEGRKTVSLGLLFAGYLRKEKIKGAYYVIEETNQIIPLPIINFSLGESKKNILKQVEKGNGIVHEIQNKLNIKQGAIYQHVQELKKEGYLENNKELKLTDLGRIMIL
mgnify:CR=1 FL=1